MTEPSTVSTSSHSETRVLSEDVPIRATINRVMTRFDGLQVHHGVLPDGWSLSADIVEDPDAVRALLDEVCLVYQMDNRQVAASFLVLGYTWQLVTGAMSCYLVDRRVPDLSSASVAMNVMHGVSFLSDHCWALKEDPEASHSTVATVATVDDLQLLLIEQFLHEHAEPLFSTLRSVAPLGINSMRANAVDRIASVIIWLADELRDPEVARREVPRFTTLANPRSRTGVQEIDHNGQSRVFIRRSGCCLNYRLPDREMCDTCCLLPEHERVERLKRHLENGT